LPDALDASVPVPLVAPFSPPVAAAANSGDAPMKTCLTNGSHCFADAPSETLFLDTVP
jgi:hypothetical protein